MEKSLLTNGKIILPEKLKINLKLNVGIIGSGKLSEDYINVAKSFDHNIKYIASLTKNKNANKLAKKNNAELLHSYNQILEAKDIDFWIVCTSWKNLKQVFLRLKHIKKPVLFEKSIIISTKELKLIKCSKNYKSIIKNFSFAYNRNYYDYIFVISSLLNKKNIKFGSAYFFDPYRNLFKNKKIREAYLPFYITSHWIALILKIFSLSKYKIQNKKIEVLDFKNNFKKIIFDLKYKKKKFTFEIFNFPNLPKNHQINFYFDDKIIEISPIESMNIYKSLIKKTKNKINTYEPLLESIHVSEKYKPGFRFQYYDFVVSNFYKKKSILSTKLNELIDIYQICNFLKK